MPMVNDSASNSPVITITGRVKRLENCDMIVGSLYLSHFEIVIMTPFPDEEDQETVPQYYKLKTRQLSPSSNRERGKDPQVKIIGKIEREGDQDVVKSSLYLGHWELKVSVPLPNDEDQETVVITCEQTIKHPSSRPGQRTQQQ